MPLGGSVHDGFSGGGAGGAAGIGGLADGGNEPVTNPMGGMTAPGGMSALGQNASAGDISKVIGAFLAGGPIAGFAAMASLGDISQLSSVTPETLADAGATPEQIAQFQQIQDQFGGLDVTNPTTLAAQIQADAIAEGNAGLQAALNNAMFGLDQAGQQNLEMLNPFITAGNTGLDNLVASQSIGGLDQRLADIMGSDAFQALKTERLNDVNSALGAAGLTRSGTAADAVSQISPELAFEIENMLFGRSNNLANLGFGATTAGVNSNTDINQAIANLLATGGIAGQQASIAGGEAIASGILGNQQIQSQQSAADDANDTALILGLLNAGVQLFPRG